MDYQWYRNDIDEAWAYQLNGLFNNINRIIEINTGHALKVPIFGINYEMNHRWGEWHKGTRQIVLAARLLKGFEWKAVEHVMRHEIAHMIVDEIFAIDGKPHGDAWATACKVVNIEANRTASSDLLAGFKGRDVSPLVEKIRKLIIHGNDAAGTKEESTVFLMKAHEMMVKHNIDMASVQGEANKRFYVRRPMGPLVKGHKGWLGRAAAFIADFYDVRCIWSYCNGKKRIEFFGTPDNLDIAEYVFHALLNTGEILWKKYYEEHKENLKDSTYRNQMGTTWNGNLHKVSKNAFMQGLVSGYRDKLFESKQEVMDKISAADGAIISTNDGMLEEAYEKEYHPRSLNSTFTSGRGYSAGQTAGKSLTLARGVTGGNFGRALSA